MAMGISMWDKTKALFVGACALALCVTLAGCAGSSGSSASAAGAGYAATDTSSSSAASAASSTDASSAATTSASAASESDVSSSTASTSAAIPAASPLSGASSNDSTGRIPGLVDAHGNITLNAIIELTGPELADLLAQQEYEWNDVDGVWTRAADGAQFAAIRHEGKFGKADYESATAEGGVAVAISCNIVAGYEDPRATLHDNARCVVEDSYFDDNGVGVAIIYGPSMVEYLVILQPYTESTTEIDIYSKEAVGSGMLDKVYGRQVGGSFAEAWKSLTGEDSYGN